MSLITCIYVNYNSAGFTVPAIQSFIKFTGLEVDYDIIVVDNASDLPDFQQLCDGLKEVECIIHRSRVNVGFGAGNMLGVNLASPSRYYAFINNDTLFTQENTLADLIKFLDTHPNAGAAGPQMMSQDGKRIPSIDHLASPARQLLPKVFLERLNPKKYPVRKATYKEPVKCGYVPGSFMVVDAAAFDKVGGFDSSLFLYYEESDLSKRLKDQLDLDTYYYPHQSYVHYQGKSTDKNKYIKLEQKISLLYYTDKHHGRFARVFMLWFYTIKYMFGAIVSKDKRFLLGALINGAGTHQSLRLKQEILPE